MAVEFKQDSILDWLLETQDKSTIKDVVQHGCQGGTISELIYYADSCAFYEKYKEEIWQRLYDSAQDCDEHQNCLHYTSTFNGGCDVASDDQFRNLLAWWAVEEVCRGICMDWDDEERATA
jgi:hypothetical protein|tara:strand:- start:54 stop:416 length:363 start_codon:yes stop_codon:yes gene_type:complete